PFNNPNAPPGPILMPQYHNSLLVQSTAQDEIASSTFERAVNARETGDKYVRTTVLLATILFLIAVSQRFGLLKVRVGLFVVALAPSALALTSMAPSPRLWGRLRSRSGRGAQGRSPAGWPEPRTP